MMPVIVIPLAHVLAPRDIQRDVTQGAERQFVCRMMRRQRQSARSQTRLYLLFDPLRERVVALIDDNQLTRRECLPFEVADRVGEESPARGAGDDEATDHGCDECIGRKSGQALLQHRLARGTTDRWSGS